MLSKPVIIQILWSWRNLFTLSIYIHDEVVLVVHMSSPCTTWDDPNAPEWNYEMVRRLHRLDNREASSPYLQEWHLQDEVPLSVDQSVHQQFGRLGGTGRSGEITSVILFRVPYTHIYLIRVLPERYAHPMPVGRAEQGHHLMFLRITSPTTRLLELAILMARLLETNRSPAPGYRSVNSNKLQSLSDFTRINPYSYGWYGKPQIQNQWLFSRRHFIIRISLFLLPCRGINQERNGKYPSNSLRYGSFLGYSSVHSTTKFHGIIKP